MCVCSCIRLYVSFMLPHKASVSYKYSFCTSGVRIFSFSFVADLSRNRLAKVTNGAFVNLSNLTYLDLSYNKLVKLEPASVVPLKSLHALNISGNIQMDLYDIRETFQVSVCLFCFYIFYRVVSNVRMYAYVRLGWI